MITLTPLSVAKVLVVGGDSLVTQILEKLAKEGLDVTTLNETRPEGPCREFVERKHTPSVEYLQSFSLVISVNQVRSFELMLADARWPNLPMIITRGVANICKMRCQYGELPLSTGGTSNFVALPMNLLPWTEEKRKLVSDIADSLSLSPAFYKAGLAVVRFREENKRWPEESDAEVLRSDDAEVQKYTDQLLLGGFGSLPETISIISSLIVHDGLGMLTGEQPVNNTNIEEVIVSWVNRNKQ
ncbi:hypothetical protein ASPZODRAFT_168724 [Penicilliopsis zonata CBS 506.65]|uniref:Uncharacterized protein n=1 Tax=Penicilliopsis zonata CBS 506.65 TaxID=1073090 RepID=A0A1L9SB99_9EURO|nr:hypothetical protein ASPZODRAFT_168724 [Penicilliopsis zonata CBS 506.65]OJJ44453.1 hypothetical protein ASPZODRAFT_168724 [Penicilliopsis zonata CBS 506.65]